MLRPVYIIVCGDPRGGSVHSVYVEESSFAYISAISVSGGI